MHSKTGKNKRHSFSKFTSSSLTIEVDLNTMKNDYKLAHTPSSVIKRKTRSFTRAYINDFQSIADQKNKEIDIKISKKILSIIGNKSQFTLHQFINCIYRFIPKNKLSTQNVAQIFKKIDSAEIGVISTLYLVKNDFLLQVIRKFQSLTRTTVDEMLNEQIIEVEMQSTKRETPIDTIVETKTEMNIEMNTILDDELMDELQIRQMMEELEILQKWVENVGKPAERRAEFLSKRLSIYESENNEINGELIQLRNINNEQLKEIQENNNYYTLNIKQRNLFINQETENENDEQFEKFKIQIKKNNELVKENLELQQIINKYEEYCQQLLMNIERDKEMIEQLNKLLADIKIKLEETQFGQEFKLKHLMEYIQELQVKNEEYLMRKQMKNESTISTIAAQISNFSIFSNKTLVNNSSDTNYNGRNSFANNSTANLFAMLKRHRSSFSDASSFAFNTENDDDFTGWETDGNVDVPLMVRDDGQSNTSLKETIPEIIQRQQTHVRENIAIELLQTLNKKYFVQIQKLKGRIIELEDNLNEQTIQMRENVNKMKNGNSSSHLSYDFDVFSVEILPEIDEKYNFEIDGENEVEFLLQKTLLREEELVEEGNVSNPACYGIFEVFQNLLQSLIS